VTLANKITTGRLLLAAVLFVLLDLLGRGDPLPGWPLATTCFFLFILVTSTDALDGYYARKLGQVSDFGRIADPAVDKVIVCGSFIFLSAVPWGREIVPPWIVVAIVAREFVVTALRGYMETIGHAFGADPAGKLKMIVQCIAVPAVIFTRMLDDLVRDDWPEVYTSFWWLAVVLVWVTLVLTVLSGVGYIKKAWEHLRGAGI
jgi:CDP-diacylglycerol--glycerol-3-phosphate 3-phosphatidyltransferase